jgi:hypothetical protein
MVCGDLRPRNAACHRAYACGVAGREGLVRAWNILALLDLAVAVLRPRAPGGRQT